MSKTKKKTPPVKLDWKRACKGETACAHTKYWESRCRRYRVQESIGKFIEMGTHYYALRVDVTGMNECWLIISRHNKRGPAEKACETYERRRRK